MADTPSITPSSSTVTPTTNTAGAAGSAEVGAITAVKAVKLVDLIIRQLPLTLKIGEDGKILKGVVIKNNPQLEEIIIKISDGEIKVKSSVPIKLNTAVSIKVFSRKDQNLADIIILKTELSPQENYKVMESLVTSKPLLPIDIKEGMIISASILPEVDTAEFKKTVDIVQNIKKEDLIKIPFNLPQKALEKLKSTNNIKEFIENLSKKEQEIFIKTIISKFSNIKPEHLNKETMHKLQQAYQPHNIEQEAVIAKYDIKTSDMDLVKIIHSDTKINTQEKTTLKENSTLSKEVVTKEVMEKIIVNKENLPLQIKESLPIISSILNEIIDKVDIPNKGLLKREYSSKEKNTGRTYKIAILKILTFNPSPENIKLALNNEVKKITPKLGNSPKENLHIAKLESLTKEGFPILKAKNAETGAIEHFIIKKALNIEPNTAFIIKTKVIITETISSPEIIIDSEVNQSSEFFATDKLDMPFSQNLKGLENFLPFASTKWPSLEQSLKILEEAIPQTAQVIKNSLPSPSKSFAPNMLFFLAALRLGSIETWLGNNSLKALKDQGKKDLIDRLTQDFGKLSNISKDSAGSDWRAVSIPLFYDDKLEQMQLFTRQHHDEDSEGFEYNKKTSRFILNLRLSRIGKMQLDGLIRNKKFDIIVRSEQKLPFNIRQEIIRRFDIGLTHVNMQGGVSFQAKAESWVKIEVPHDDNIMA